MSFTPVASMKGQSFLSVNQLNRADLDALINLAEQMRKHVESGKTIDALRGRVLSPLFFEDSSRTLSSFCSAMLRLGGGVVNFKVEGSAMGKGETLQDTVRMLDSYSDVIVMRHPNESSVGDAAKVAKHPIMNGGNGTGEHPTQALMDAYTIQAELGHVDGVTIAMIGDLRYGRTVHSLLRILTRNYNIRKIYLIAPKSLEMPKDVLDAVMPDIEKRGIALEYGTALTPEIVADCDVLYVTRLQKERTIKSVADSTALASYERIKDQIRVNKARLENAKEKMIVMHPLPRLDELSTDIDDDPRAAYFRQMEYGQYVRMALLFSVLM